MASPVFDTLSTAKELVIDLETNSLFAFKPGSQVIGYAIYVVDTDESFYFPFHHGEGRFEVKYTATNPATKSYREMNWQGDTKRALFANYWWGKWYDPATFGNLSLELERELLQALAANSNAVWYMHNASFDMTWLAARGVTPPALVYDTMVGMHVLHEDMRRVQFDAPYKWAAKDATAGRCKPEQVGQWSGKSKNQPGNYQLKWLSALFDLDGATSGEDSLHAAQEAVLEELCQYILAHPESEYYEPDPKHILSGYVNKKAFMWTATGEAVAHYAKTDTKLTYLLHNELIERLERWDNVDLYEQQCRIQRSVTWPAYYVGIPFNVKAAKKEQQRISERMQDIIVELDKAAPGLSPTSPASILRTLPSILDVELAKTDKATLKEFAGHPVVDAILEYRKLSKSIGTYIKRWIEHADANGRIHPRLNITGTVSGRLSSSGDESGNFQNIPDRGGYKLKTAFEAPPGQTMVGIDYGQLELRLACWVAEGQLGFGHQMTDLFLTGVDMHAYTRDNVGIRNIVYRGMSDEHVMALLGYDGLEDADKIIATRCRFIAKTMNFGLLYGGGGGMLSRLLDMDRDTADQLVFEWRGLFPAFIKANQYYENLALRWRPLPGAPDEKTQFVTQPLTGRHRRFSLYRDRVYSVDAQGIKTSYNEREYFARKAFNNVIQGLGGEISKYSAWRMAEEMPEVHIFNIIHDSIDFFAPTEGLTGYIDRATLIMKDWEIVPALTVDVQTGQNWQDMK